MANHYNIVEHHDITFIKMKFYSPPEVGIYKIKQESKKTRKKGKKIDQESDQEKKRKQEFDQESDQEKN